MSRKSLYEDIQALEAKNKSLMNQISRMQVGELYSKKEFNPIIANSSSYNTVLRVADKIEAVNRYETYIEDLALPSNKLECLWYENGALAFFRDNADVCKVGSFAKGGSLNGLGDLSEAEPIDFAGKSYGFKRTVVYTHDRVINPCIIIQDYTGSVMEGQIIPRAALNSVSINDQAEVYRQLKNSIKITAKKVIALITSATQSQAIVDNIRTMLDNDDPIVPIVDGLAEAIKINNLDTDLDIEGYLKAIECYEKMRANFNGIRTRALIEKKEREITGENEDKNCLTDLFLYDGLINRQIGIELAKEHGIIRGEAYCKINPIEIEKGENNDNNIVQDGDRK